MSKSVEVCTIAGTGVPLVGNDIDTDRIIPARFLRAVTFDGLGDEVFADDRKQLADHPFNQARFKEAKVLVVNRNFGCGSSREHAPQAIARWGIEALIGESFAEIFFGNCVAMGVPCLIADGKSIKALQQAIEAHPDMELQVDLEEMTVKADNLTISVEMSEGARQMFLSGTWDACGQLVAQSEAIQETASALLYIGWAAS